MGYSRMLNNDISNFSNISYFAILSVIVLDSIELRDLKSNNLEIFCKHHWSESTQLFYALKTFRARSYHFITTVNHIQYLNCVLYIRNIYLENECIHKLSCSNSYE